MAKGYCPQDWRQLSVPQDFQLSPLLDGRPVKAQEAEYQKQLEETKVEVEEERAEGLLQL